MSRALSMAIDAHAYREKCSKAIDAHGHLNDDDVKTYKLLFNALNNFEMALTSKKFTKKDVIDAANRYIMIIETLSCVLKSSQNE